MNKEIAREDFDVLSAADKATAARTMRIVDPVRKQSPDMTRLVHVADGVRREFTREEFAALPVMDQARMGAALSVETVQAAPEGAAS
jgi:hypothetical protein